MKEETEAHEDEINHSRYRRWNQDLTQNPGSLPPSLCVCTYTNMPPDVAREVPHHQCWLLLEELFFCLIH